jgi:hypothetical protein
VLTIEQVDELIKGGTQRARERCAAELAKGNYFAGCPRLEQAVLARIPLNCSDIIHGGTRTRQVLL